MTFAYGYSIRRIPLIIMIVFCCCCFWSLAHRWIHSYARLLDISCFWHFWHNVQVAAEFAKHTGDANISTVFVVKQLPLLTRFTHWNLECRWFLLLFFLGKSLQHVETPHVIQLTSDHRHHASRRKPQPSIIIQIKWTYWDIRFAVKINYDDRTICLVNSDWCQSVVDIVKFIKLQAYITLKLPSYLLVCTISAQCWYTRFIFDIKLIINVAVA